MTVDFRCSTDSSVIKNCIINQSLPEIIPFSCVFYSSGDRESRECYWLLFLYFLVRVFSVIATALVFSEMQ